MATVRDILARKGSAIASTTPETTVFEAAVKMNEHKIGSLVVLDEGRTHSQEQTIHLLQAYISGQV